MTQSSLHVAIIMDGNGRWAQARGRRREWGHREGARAAKRAVRAAPDLGIGVLTLYAFSSDNWQRPAGEVRLLMRLFRRYLKTEVRELKAQGVRLQIVGRRDRLTPELVRAVEEAERETAEQTRMCLRIAVDYSSRELLLRAVQSITDPEALDRESFAAQLGAAMNSPDGAPDVDLLIRTGGEKRLSDFLLWECAYAELAFTPGMWPDFDGEELGRQIGEFHGRERRFGRVAVAS